MPRRFPKRSFPQAEPGSFILEAVVASMAAIGVLALIAPMFARQIALARQARDTQYLEEVVSRDISAYRQYATYWRRQSGFSSDRTLNKPVNQVAGFDTYNNTNTTTYFGLAECGIKASSEFAFNTDLPRGLKYSGADEFSPKDPLYVPKDPPYRYKVNRAVSFIRSTDGSVPPVVRLTYTVEPQGDALDLSFFRTADLQVQAQNWC